MIWSVVWWLYSYSEVPVAKIFTHLIWTSMWRLMLDLKFRLPPSQIIVGPGNDPKPPHRLQHFRNRTDIHIWDSSFSTHSSRLPPTTGYPVRQNENWWIWSSDLTSSRDLGRTIRLQANNFLKTNLLHRPRCRPEHRVVDDYNSRWNGAGEKQEEKDAVQEETGRKRPKTNDEHRSTGKRKYHLTK